MSGNYEWHPRPPNTTERLVGGAYGLALALAMASHYLEWRLFGDYDRYVFLALLMLGLFLLRFAPRARRREDDT